MIVFRILNIEVKVMIVFSLQARHFQRLIKSNSSSCEDCLSVSLTNVMRITGSFPVASIKAIKKCVEDNMSCRSSKNKRMLTGRVLNGKREQVNCIHLKIHVLGEEVVKYYKGLVFLLIFSWTLCIQCLEKNRRSSR